MPLGPSKRRRVTGAWNRLVAEIAAWPDDALISMEWLGPASTPTGSASWWTTSARRGCR